MRLSLYEGCALEVVASLPPSSIDLVLADLPYGTTRNSWDSVIPLDRMWSLIHRVLTPRGNVVLTSQGLFTSRLMSSNEEEYRYKYVWVKSKATNFLNVKRQPMRKHEDVCVFHRGGPVYNPQRGEGAAYDKGVRKDQVTGSYGEFRPARVRSEGGRWPTDVLYFATAESEGRVWHPTQKPVSLGRWLVRTYSDPGSTVLDFASGSGSFPVSAIAEGRHAIGVELYPRSRSADGNPVDLLDVTAQRALAFNAACEVVAHRA